MRLHGQRRSLCSCIIEKQLLKCGSLILSKDFHVLLLILARTPLLTCLLLYGLTFFLMHFSRQRRGWLPGPGPAEWQSCAQVQPGIGRGDNSQWSTGPAGQHPQRHVRKIRENRMAEGDLATGVEVLESRVRPSQEKATFLNCSFRKLARTKALKVSFFSGTGMTLHGLLTIL